MLFLANFSDVVMVIVFSLSGFSAESAISQCHSNLGKGGDGKGTGRGTNRDRSARDRAAPYQIATNGHDYVTRPGARESPKGHGKGGSKGQGKGKGGGLPAMLLCCYFCVILTNF